MEVRALREQDHRTAFTSGDADLDRFFLKYAGQNQFRHHIGKAAQGRGIGSTLLHAVIHLALTQADAVGCVGIVVDAKPPAVAWYDRYGFFPLPALEGESAARPRPLRHGRGHNRPAPGPAANRGFGRGWPHATMPA